MGEGLKFVTFVGGLRKKRKKNFCVFCKTNLILRPFQQGWQYDTVRLKFAYNVPLTLNRTVPAYRTSVQFLEGTVPTYRTRTIAKKAYRTSVPYF